MKLRMSLITAGIMAVMTGCAASSGGNTGTTAAPSIRGEQIAQGEPERRNDMTRSAARALEDAQDPENEAQQQMLYQEALTAAESAISADPTNPLPHLQAAYAYVGLEDWENAARMFDEAETLRPIYVLETERIREQAWIQLYQQGADAVNSGQYEMAVDYFRAADDMYEERPEVKYYLGQLLVSLGEYDEGVEVLQEARAIIESDRIEEMDSTTVAAWQAQASDIPVTVARAYLGAGRLDEARGALRDLLADDPENTDYLNSLATVFVQMEMPDSADAVYDRLMTMEGLQGTALYNIGVGRYQSEDYVGAAEAFQRAFETSVNDRDALEMYARSIQIAYGNSEGAMEPPAGALDELMTVVERWRDLDPNNRNAYLIMAQTANRLGNSQLAGQNVQSIEQLPFMVDNLTLQRNSNGGGMVVGILTNNTVPEGQPIELEFTFYDADGGVIGTQSVTTPAPAAEGTRQIQVTFDSDQKIHGYGYSSGM